MDSSKQVAVQGFATIGGAKFDIKRVMLGVLPSITGILVELLTTGKISGKQRDLGLIKEVLESVIVELDTVMESKGL